MNHFIIFLIAWIILTSEGTKTWRIFSVENKKTKPPFWRLKKLCAFRPIVPEDRINGVVVTFVDITPRKEAEQQLRDSVSELARFNLAMENR